MQTTFERAVELFWRGHTGLHVAQQLGIGDGDIIDEAQHFVTEKRQSATVIAHAMFRAGTKHRDVINALRDLGLPAHDADEISLRAMAVVRRERASVTEDPKAK